MSDNQKKEAPFVIENGIARGALIHGIKIGEKTHKDFEMREYKTADLLDAETEAPVMNVLNFQAQLMVLQLVRVGDFKGPFTIGQIRALEPADWRRLRAAQTGLEKLGEVESAGSGQL